jgi:hypothetical protein
MACSWRHTAAYFGIRYHDNKWNASYHTTPASQVGTRQHRAYPNISYEPRFDEVIAQTWIQMGSRCNDLGSLDSLAGSQRGRSR